MIIKTKVRKYPRGIGALGLMFFYSKRQLEMQLRFVKWFVGIRMWQGKE